MPNENEVVVEETVEQVAEETTETTETTETDTTDWKAKYEETQGRLKRAETKLAKVSETKPEKSSPSKSGDLDYGQKAYLVANGIKGEEMNLVKEVMANTGKSLDEVLESKYFQAELKEFREAKAVEEATPSGTPRSGQSSRDSVEYWLAKGEMPPADQRELRQQYVNAKMKAETNKNIFTENPVVK